MNYNLYKFRKITQKTHLFNAVNVQRRGRQVTAGKHCKQLSVP